MSADGRAPADSPFPLRRAHGFAVPALAVFGDGTSWLEGTAIALAVVLALGILGSLLLAAGRRFRWWSSAGEIQIKRTFRVTFGGLFLAALTVPYVVARAPAIGLAVLMLGAVVSVSLLLPVGRRAGSERSTGEHAEIE